MNLFDTHAHFSGDRDKVRETLDRAFRAGVSNLMAVGGSPELNSAALLAAEAATDADGKPAVRLALGLDRDQASDSGAACPRYDLSCVIDRRDRLSAIGEIGLDFHYPGVELANLSSMIENLLGEGLASASNGLYARNRPHAFPDLIPQDGKHGDLEIKVALEKNKPKGHLPKAGNYITFRYVLCNDDGVYAKGKETRGNRVFIWEIKVGTIAEADFDLSNTDGDSGKTAVIKTKVFNDMALVYFDRDLLPYSSKSEQYPGFN